LKEIFQIASMKSNKAQRRGSRVRVGLRVRPLTSQEIKQGGHASLNIDPPTIRMGKRRFTYDAVFDSNCGQDELYESASTPLLRSFIDGYNATIMAYGQTGSGKTFTMGSEAHIEPESSSQTGLIPRFITDFFHEMHRKKAASDDGVQGDQILLDYSLKASFLEVYGEDVFDLLNEHRCSLPLREDSNGGIVVAGLTSRDISTTVEALQVLHEGTMNRTTAATLMNLTSSRSHAVFTIQLSQVTRLNTSESDNETTTISRFTFVDLAGSERMKKTGAEGERAREGIKINEGLLALGNVINALADEKRALKEKKIHVPYRQSKLTRLLQDALGGNSQTLFLACVSPSDTNASETLSTLNYANRARNIRNAPTKNVDGSSAQLQRLQNINRILQCELIKYRFQASTLTEKENQIGIIDLSLLKRDDVETYIQTVHNVAGTSMSSNAMPLSSSSSLIPFETTPKNFNPTLEFHNSRSQEYADINKTHKRSCENFDHSILEDINPDEEMAILDHLLEQYQHEHDYEKAKDQDDFKLREMNGELEMQESLLLQLRDSLKVYHGLKGKYEELMEEVQQLETEKSSLAKQLERDKSDPKTGCSAILRKKIDTVEKNLSRARQETLNHQKKHRMSEDQARKCKVLERKVNELKRSKSALLQKKKEEAAHYKKMTDAKTREYLELKRKANNTDRKMSKLENELNIQKENSSKRSQYCTKLSEKLKQTENHLKKVIAMRRRGNVKRSHLSQSYPGRSNTSKESLETPLSNDEIKKFGYIFDRMVVDKVKQGRLRKKFEDLTSTYSETMRRLLSEVKLLKDKRGVSVNDEHGVADTSTTVKDLREKIADLELKLELIDSELQETTAQMPKDIKSSEQDIDEAVTTLMKGMSTCALKSILLETFSKFVEAETDRQTGAESIQRKDAALLSVETEVDLLNFKIKSLSRDLADRKVLDESGNDQFQVIKQLREDKNRCENSLSAMHANLENSNSKILQLEKSLSTVRAELSSSQENLTVTKVTLKKSDIDNEVVNETVKSLQHIWGELGADNSLRGDARKKIETCLEDTCKNVLENAMTIKSSTEQEIKVLSYRRQMMGAALGILVHQDDSNIEETSLLLTLKKLRDEVSSLEVPYRFAAARRRKIVEAAIDLSTTLGMSSVNLHKDLQVLLEHGRNIPSTKDGKESCASTPISCIALPSNCLETEFLTRCDNHVTEMRVAKSEMLLKSREYQQMIADLIGEMHLNDREEALELVENWINQNEHANPKWWNSKLSGNILYDVGRMKFLSNSSPIISQHLELLCKALSSLADCRRSFSVTLKSVIENAQKTLLDIVGREIDASQAYAGLHDALFRLPPLSKDLILSCITELEVLMDGIEAMTQSEIEALTVVWGALKVSSENRRNFWGMLEKSGSKIEPSTKNQFIARLSGSTSSSEAWLVDAIARATDINDKINMRLKKLEKIHEKVEKLRSKQDIKSQILSLDSEIRIMNTTLLDFEELKCNKQRLLSKKNSGAALLKEENFRKQMQTKFSSSLQQLVTLLRSWERKENISFDDSLLSDDVRDLLKEDPDKMENWVQRRTELMTLRTVKSQTPRKRAFESSDSTSYRHAKREKNVRHVTGLTPPVKRVTSITRKDTKNKKARILSINTMMQKNKAHNGKHSIDESSRCPKKQEKAASILPFGRILADSPTNNNENII